MQATFLTIMEWFETIVGIVPPEFEGLVYVFALLIALFVLILFFDLLKTVFGVTKWQRLG